MAVRLMWFFRNCVGILLVSAALADGQVTISNETAPPGGAAQVKVWPAAPGTAAPTHITLDFESAVVGSVQGVGAFNADGDIYGVSAIDGTHVEALLSTGFVGVRKLPLLTATVRIRPDVAPGTRSSVRLAAIDDSGRATVIAEGSLTVGGDLWIDDISLAEGLLPTGSVVTIRGGGFTADTTVEFDAVAIASAQVISSGEIDVTLAAPAEMKGKRARVQRGDAAVNYYCSKNAVSSSPSLFRSSGIQVMFPPRLVTSVVVPAGPAQAPVGLAVENSSASPISVDFYGVGAFDARGPTTVTIAAGGVWLQYVQSLVSSRIGLLHVVAPVPVRIVSFSWLLASDRLLFVYVPGSASPPAPPHVLFEGSTISSTGIFDSQVGSPQPTPQTFRIYVPSNVPTPQFRASAATNSGGNWLHAVLMSGNSVPLLSISVDPAGLMPGAYAGAVIVSASDPTVLPAIIPVTLTVSLQPLITISSSYLQFDVVSNGVVPPAKTVQVQSTGTPAQFTVSGTTDSKGSATACVEGFGALSCDWIIISMAKGTTPATLSITVNPAGVTPGNHEGTVTITGPRNMQNFPVFMNVYPQPASLAFVARAGSGPMTKTIVVPNPTQATVATDSGGNWLSATVTGGNVVVTENPAGLSAGAYSGNVKIASTLGAASVPVTLRIWDGTPPQLTVSQQQVDFMGDASESFEKHLTVATGDVPEDVSVAVTNGSADANFVAFVATNTTPTDLVIGVDARGLRPGFYRGTVTVKAGAQSVDIPVTLTLTSGVVVTPMVGAIVNGASAIQGAVAPGEIITLHGTKLGPPTAAGLVLQNGQPATTLSGTRVLFDGVPAPMLYAASDQLNVIVPRDIAGRSVTLVEVEYFGTRSTAIGIPVVDASPAVFTLDSSGAGAGAVLNEDNTVNGPANPAARGSVIQIFGTGAAGPVAVTIGGVEAQVTYAGPAPQSVDGLLQVNAIVPPSLMPDSAASLLLTIGSVRSPDGVSIAVK